MKRRILKILAPLALIAVLLFSSIFVSGCYIVKGVKMKDLKGTYEMTRYSTDIDRMTEKEIKMYMVINSDGKGYYVYQDKDTAVYAAELRCRFTNNQEDSSKYDYVECEFSGANASSDSWYKFGVNSKNLNYHRIVWKPLEWGKPLEKDYDINVSFNKVSSKTDLSFVEDKLGVKLTATPYGLARHQALYELNGVSVSGWYLTRGEVAERGLEEPIYAYIRLDVMNSKATVYYMMASDEVQKEIEFIYDITNNGDGTFYLTDKKGGRWSLDYSGLHYLASVEGEAGTEAWSWDFGWTNIFEYDLTEEIATNVSAYESDKCSFKGHEWTQDDADLCAYKKICAVCGIEEGENVEHQYDNDDDAICNVCEKEREIEKCVYVFTLVYDNGEPITDMSIQLCTVDATTGELGMCYAPITADANGKINYNPNGFPGEGIYEIHLLDSSMQAVSFKGDKTTTKELLSYTLTVVLTDKKCDECDTEENVKVYETKDGDEVEYCPECYAEKVADNLFGGLLG